MIKRISVGWRLSIPAISVVLLSSHAAAATPQQIARGQQLFTQEFASMPLSENGDGLGPVFNHTSCVACHRAGGVGGAGDLRFNARTFSTSEIRFSPYANDRSLAQALTIVAPGFVSADGQIANTAPMHRRGGSSEFDQLRQQTMARFNPDWLDDESINSDAIHAEGSPQQIVSSGGSLSMTGHVFGRNTTPLFGSGLIDRVPDSVIREQFKAQQRHPEIHGRPATLADGRIGKFGWRANFATLLDFTENACVNELGLQSKAVSQPKDITQPWYVNTRIDIDNQSIIALTSFIAALPSPTRQAADGAQHHQELSLGQTRFRAVGCAICHVPNLGPALGLYSDLLLHDMGPSLYDYNPAPPYRKSIEFDYKIIQAINRGSYYGSLLTVPESNYNLSGDSAGEYRFEASQRSPKSITEPVRFGRDDVMVENNVAPGLRQVVYQRVSQSDVIPTNFTQEWRTAPLWGVRDSAPYLHDGRAETVLEAIAMHGGEAEQTRNRFFALPYEDQMAVLAFLNTFVAPQSGVIPISKDLNSKRHSRSQN